MQSTTSLTTPQSVCCCCYPIPNHLRRNLINFPSSTNQTHFPKTPFLPLSSTTTTNNSISKHHKKKNNTWVFQSYSTPSHAFLEDFYSYTDNSNQIRTAHNQQQGDNRAEEGIQNRVKKKKKSEGIFTSMWWADLRAALGQRINLEAIVCSAKVVTKDRHLAIPHIAVPDIRHIDWAELRRRGFKGVVFDKDNTITAPYSLKLWGPLGSSLEQCKSVFGDDIAVFSNSSGLYEYDPDFSKARILESAIGIKVLRHKVKKPGGTAEEIEEHFGCESSKLIMVGDRPLTDIVYGNRNGFLTILTEPLTLVEEPFIVKQVRKLETFLVNRWCKRGLRPTSHNLLPDVMQCVKDPPSL